MKRASKVPSATPQEDRRGRSRPPLERMLRIHQALAAGGFPNATALSQSLEVCAKSIHRDLEFMRDRLGLPIEYEPTKRGYRYTEEVRSFPTLQISEGELFALMVAEKALQQYRGTPFEKPLMSAFQKMADALPEAVSLNLDEWGKAISFRTSAEPLVNAHVFARVAEAVTHRKRIAVAYRKPGARETEERVVDPLHVANINGEWYLFAFDHLRKDLRTFSPARIQEIRETGETFERPEKFSLEHRLRGSFGVHSADGDYRVLLRAGPDIADYLREKKWHASQQIHPRNDGGLDLSMRLSSLIEIERWILGWGGRVQVIEPPELRSLIAAAARRLLNAPPEKPSQRL